MSTSPVVPWGAGTSGAVSQSCPRQPAVTPAPGTSGVVLLMSKSRWEAPGAAQKMTDENTGFMSGLPGLQTKQADRLNEHASLWAVLSCLRDGDNRELPAC